MRVALLFGLALASVPITNSFLVLPASRSLAQSLCTRDGPKNMNILKFQLDAHKRVNRGGGRARKPKLRESSNKKNSKWFAVLAPLLLIAILSNLLFGGSSEPQTGFYYYQSSSFESRVYSDGKVNSARKESVRTNMPSMLQNSAPSSAIDFNTLPDRTFERELNDEIENMRKFERTIFDDFL